MKVIGLETEKGKESGNETTQEPKSNSSSAMDLEASSTGDNKATSSEKMETDEAERGEAKRKDENGDKEVQTEQQAAGAPTEPPKPANNNDDDGSWLVEEEGKGEIPISQRQYISSATPSSDSSSPKIASPYIDPSEIKAAAAAAIGAAAARAKVRTTKPNWRDQNPIHHVVVTDSGRRRGKGDPETCCHSCGGSTPKIGRQTRAFPPARTGPREGATERTSKPLSFDPACLTILPSFLLMNGNYLKRRHPSPARAGATEVVC